MNSISNGNNRLYLEKSPYLRQHKDNPVNWFAWGGEPFDIAQKEGKPVFLSIGYSTCYWCHVMEKDSFEKDDVAAILNDHFISIKVDREERSDLDSIYMDALVGMTGHGGWPMSLFLTPTRKPFYAGTYFPREQFKQILIAINEAWRDRHGEILESADKITQFLDRSSTHDQSGRSLEHLSDQAIKSLEKSFDSEYGGFGGAPKFPPTGAVSFLFNTSVHTKDKDALNMAIRTLDRMAHGGIYDHLGGGFHRYSVDERWLVPHFEKMLYDNALLAVNYIEAYQVTKNSSFQDIAKETLDYVIREMVAPEGGFCSAQDAGEVEKEGEYYVWKETELREILGDIEFRTFAEVFDISPSGNFENGTNVLSVRYEVNLDKRELGPVFACRAKLLSARAKRLAPLKDDKVLLSWNGLMISAMAKGYSVIHDDRYLRSAQSCAMFLKTKLYVAGKLYRRYRDGEAQFAACADDFAFYIAGLLDLYQADFDSDWLILARELQELQNKELWDDEVGGYYYSSADDLIARKKDLSDGAVPSSNALSLSNLRKLSFYFFEMEFRSKADRLEKLLLGEMSNYPAAYARSISTIQFPFKEVVIIEGEKGLKLELLIKALRERFGPNTIIAVKKLDQKAENIPVLHGKSNLEGKTAIYLCKEGVCFPPNSDPPY